MKENNSSKLFLFNRKSGKIQDLFEENEKNIRCSDKP